MEFSLLHRLLLPLLVCFGLLLQPTTWASSLHSSEVRLFLRRHSRSKILHPSTGLCVARRLISDPLKLGSCSESDSWQHTPQQFLVVSGTYLCLEAVGLGQPVKLGIICHSQWVVMSASQKTHLATKLADGTQVCLDVDSDDTLVSNSCSGSYEEEEAENDKDAVDSQWFKLVTTYT